MRKPRKLRKGSNYHVTARANRKEMIFEDDQFKSLFLEILRESKMRYKIIITNFCIMGNHIHLIIKPGETENLSRIMQWILSVFAIRFNKRMNYSGHVFHDRFHSKIIDDIRQLIATFCYISENPVKAELVKCPFDYKYNGIVFIKNKIFDVIDPPPDFLMKQYH